MGVVLSMSLRKEKPRQVLHPPFLKDVRMKLPSSKIYWADFLSYSAILSDKEICQVLKVIAKLSMSYENPQDNLRDNPQDNKLILIHKQIQKFNKIQYDFYMCLKKAQDESAKSYLASITNGKLGGRPKNQKNQNNQKNQYEQTETETLNRNRREIPKVEIGSKVINFNKYKINENFNVFDVPDVEIYKKEVGEDIILKVDAWLKKNMAGQVVDKNFICKQIYNFSLKNGLVGER